mgnify:CR=1 FL=1
MLQSPPAPPIRRLAAFHPPKARDPLLREWLLPSRDALFRWVMSMAAGAEGRRLVAETAVSIQRLRGEAEFTTWLYATAVQAARLQGDEWPEASLAGLPPELRALLRLAGRQVLRREEAMALLAQHMAFVRRHLVQTRLAQHSAPVPLDC